MTAVQSIDSCPSPALNAEGLVKRFGKRLVLDGVSLSVAKGAAVGLVGANGAGKTTFLKCLLDLCHVDGGRITFFGQPASQPSSRRRLAYVPERFMPPHFLLGGEFLRMTLALAGEAYDASAAARLLEELELDALVLERPVRQFSKGMTQKLGLAGCFLQPRPLYILDEPMSGLDPASRMAVKRVLARLHGAGCALLFTSHVLADVEELCSSVAVLERGQLRFEGSPTELRERHGGRSLEQAFLNCIRAPAPVGGHAAAARR